MAVDKQQVRGTAPASVAQVGREVRRWRQVRGLTLAQVGERSGLNVGYLSQIENEKALPSLEARPRSPGRSTCPPRGCCSTRRRRPALSARMSAHTQPAPAAPSDRGRRGTSRDVCIIEVSAPPGLATGVHAHHGDEHHVILSGRWR